MTLLRCQDSNLGSPVQSRMPYHLATPQLSTELSVENQMSTPQVIKAQLPRNIEDSPDVQQRSALRIQNSPSKKCHADWTQPSQSYKNSTDNYGRRAGRP